MPETTYCSQCGEALAASAIDNSCPACLLESGILSGKPELPLRPDQRVGRYELLEEIARGGMGVVHKGWDTELDRLVAVKMILSGQFASSVDVDRFRAEARAAAGLKHPNIVAIHEVGESEGRHFFAMDFVEGPTLRQLIRDNPLPAHRAAGYVKTIAEAVQYAHEHGIVHRDLKPSNVLIDAADQPHVTDFGLAKRIDSKADLTLSGAAMGTPGYMPPEQASGQSKTVGPTADVYALGAMLYDLLTGRPPFRAETPLETMAQAVSKEPVAPRLLNASVPPDIETICLKCLEKEPSRRYGTAKEVALELGRFLNDEPIHARPVGAGERLWRWCRRRPAVAVPIAVAVVLAVTVAVVSTVSAARLKIANAQSTEKLRASYLDQAKVNRLSNRLGRRFQSLDALRKAAEIRPSIELRNEAIAALALFDLRPLRQWDAARSVVTVFDAAYERYATADTNGVITIRRAVDDVELARITPAPGQAGFDSVSNAVSLLRFSRDGRFLAVYSQDPSTSTQLFEVFDISSHEVRFQLKGTAVLAFDFNPKRSCLAVATRAKQPGPATVTIHNLETRRVDSAFQPESVPNAMRYDPSGDRLAMSSSEQAAVELWDALRTNSLGLLAFRSSAFRGIDWDATGKYLVGASENGQICVWDVPRRTVVSPLPGHSQPINAIQCDPSGQVIVSNGQDDLMRIWDFHSGREVLQESVYDCLPFSTNGNRIGYHSSASRLVMCEVGRSSVWRQIPPAPDSDTAGGCAFQQDGRIFACATQKGVFGWDVAAMKPHVTVFQSRAKTVFFQESTHSMLVEADGGLLRWPIREAGTPDHPTIRAGPGEQLGIGLGSGTIADAQGRFVARWDKNDITVIDLNKEFGSETFQTPPGASGIALSPDGGRLVAWAGDSVPLVAWDVRPRKSLGGPIHRGTTSAAFTPDGRLLLTGSADHYTAWSLDTWQALYSIPRIGTGRTGGLIAISSNGAMAAVTASLNIVQLIDAATGQELARLESPETARITHMTFSPDGTRLVVMAERAGPQFWDLRALRRELAGLNLDWSGAAFPEATTPRPLPRFEPVEQAKRREVTKALSPEVRQQIPPRPTGCDSTMLDLTPHYNAPLTNAWTSWRENGNDLSSLDQGSLRLKGGLQYDVRGIVQLGSSNASLPFDYPAETKGISVGQRCVTLHFLHATSGRVEDESVVGHYVVHYAEGPPVRIPLAYGIQLADWWAESASWGRHKTEATYIRGANVASQKLRRTIKLYEYPWKNPRPGVVIQSIDFYSDHTPAAPFLLGITVE